VNIAVYPAHSKMKLCCSVIIILHDSAGDK